MTHTVWFHIKCRMHASGAGADVSASAIQMMVVLHKNGSFAPIQLHQLRRSRNRCHRINTIDV